MNYEEKFNYITSLGWTKLGDWNDREIYTLVYDGESLGQLIAHNGNWSIPRGNDLYYIEDPSIEVITEYTNILKALIKAIKENITPRNKYLISIALSEASKSVNYWKVKLCFFHNILRLKNLVLAGILREKYISALEMATYRE